MSKPWKVVATWDVEIARIKHYAPHFALAHKATAVIGVAVDDARKRDYFVPRLRQIVDTETWARHLIFRVVPMNGDAVIEVKTTPPVEPGERT